MFGNDKKMLPAVDAMSEGDWSLGYELIKGLADEGIPDAEHFMGWFYEQGIEVEQSDQEAFKWWSRAAAKGVPESQNGVALMYHHGRGGVDIDLEQAYFWYSIAYKNGDSPSRPSIQKIAKELSDEQLARLNQKIKESTALLESNVT